MLTTLIKPKLVFFQNHYDDGLPEFLLTHVQEHVNCLSEFFDVTVIQHDCDYRQICDLYLPDLALFETGVNLLTCRRPKIANVRACRDIPKLGLLNADAWCETRSGSFSEMDQWGLEAVFSISATATEHMPAIADQLFIWPNCVDPAIYRDYSEPKLIPVLLSGATAAQYPWRRRVYKTISEHYPSMTCPHRGYLARSSTSQVLYGERYARSISASVVAPVCGTVAREIVRKHFEIPACNTCLVTERARNIEEAGFVDMTNCVFADEHDILDKLEFLFKNPDTLQDITAAGHRLVHSRHTQRHRDQILQWFNLNRDLKPHEKIVQSGPFKPLTVAKTGSHPADARATEVGIHLQLLREGDERLSAGEVDAAASKYRRCLSYMHKLPEARFKVALCNLYRGDANDANERIFELIQYCLAEYGAIDPDPVEWAYYIISFLCMGKVSDARKCALEFPWLHHPELDRVRGIVQILKYSDVSERAAWDVSMRRRQSIHRLPERTGSEWLEELYRILWACGQTAITTMIASAKSELQTTEKFSPLGAARLLGGDDNESQDASDGSPVGDVRGRRRVGVLSRKLIRFKGRRKLRTILARFTHLLQQVRRQFFRVSQSPVKDEQFIAAIRDAARDLNIRTALVVGGGAGDDAVKALQEGTRGSDHKHLICRISDSRLSLVDNFDSDPASGSILRHTVSLTSTPAALSSVFEKVLNQVSCDGSLDCFDAVIITWPETDHRASVSRSLLEKIREARLVVLGDMRSEYHRAVFANLLVHPHYVLVDHDATGDSYVMFRRRSSATHQADALASASSLPSYVT